jgi:ubiquinone/menaquinone biosynthesis C-methylase UbiE
MVRRNQTEMMDQPETHPSLLADDLRNLETLNRLFAGQEVVRRRVGPLLDAWPAGQPISILDIGSGSGDLCRVIVDECRRRGLAVRLGSLDFHAQVQACARERCADRYPEIRFIRGDARCIPLADAAVDLAVCTLALHHFTEEDAAAVLSEMRRVSRRWALVSDLARSPQAYAAVWLATRFTRNPMTRFDGPVSVQRAFTPEELRALAASAGWVPARFYPEPWFRMSLVYGKDAA